MFGAKMINGIFIICLAVLIFIGYLVLADDE